jgi:hypothetical protein
LAPSEQVCTDPLGCDSKVRGELMPAGFVLERSTEAAAKQRTVAE